MSKDDPQRRILLCVAGMTPQIITETLYAMTQERGERVDEVRVITTLEGHNHLLTALLDKEHGEFFKFCRDYDIDASSIKFDETTIALLRTPDGRTLEDIRTPEDNESAADQICEIVRELAKDKGTRIHASAAGGRKTMSIYLTAAMQLFGRAHDTLSHVLINEDFETSRDFFYPPPVPRTFRTRDGREVSTPDARIYLADVKFIRLRGVSADTLSSGGAHFYGEIVERAQDLLDVIESEYDLQIDLGRYTVTVRGQSIKLSPREMFFYAMFADFRRREFSDGAVALTQLKPHHFADTFVSIAVARGEEVGWEEAASYPGFDFLGSMTSQLSSDRGDEWFEFKDKFHVIASRIRSAFRKKGCDERYVISLRDERGTARYGLAISPERIKFI